jgi:hypothetical protein
LDQITPIKRIADNIKKGITNLFVEFWLKSANGKKKHFFTETSAEGTFGTYEYLNGLLYFFLLGEIQDEKT